MAIKDWTDGDYVYGVDMDDITKQVNHIFTDITAANAVLTGDLAPKPGMRLYTGDGIHWTRIGSPAMWVPVSGTVLTDVFSNADLPLPVSSTNYPITGMSQTYTNRAGAWNAATGRFTAPYPGNYQFNQTACFAQNVTGVRQLFYRINGGSTAVGSVRTLQALTGFPTPIQNVHNIYLSQNDTIDPMVMQTSGGALSLIAATFPHYQPRFTAIYLGM